MLAPRLGIFLVGLGGRAFAADVDVQLAEIQGEAPVHLEVDRLLAEEDDAVSAERFLDVIHLLRRQRLRQIHIADLGADVRRKRRYGDGGEAFHSYSSLAPVSRMMRPQR